MEDDADGLACFVGVKTGPRPGATDLRGVVGGCCCCCAGRVTLDDDTGAEGPAAAWAGPCGAVFPSRLGGNTTADVAGEPTGGVRAAAGWGMRHDPAGPEPDGMRGIAAALPGESSEARGGVPRGAAAAGGTLLVDASAMIAFMSVLGADVMVRQPVWRAGDSLPLGTREGGPGAGTNNAEESGTGSGSSIMNISSSGMPVATGRPLNVGRSIGLFGADASDRRVCRLPGPGGESFGESLNVPGRKEGTIGCGKSWSASQSPHISIALSMIRVERETGYFSACAVRTYAESCLTRSGAMSSSIRLSRKTSMLIAMYSWRRLIRAVAW